jgi:hypothetical protein
MAKVLLGILFGFGTIFSTAHAAGRSVCTPRLRPVTTQNEFARYESSVEGVDRDGHATIEASVAFEDYESDSTSAIYEGGTSEGRSGPDGY